MTNDPKQLDLFDEGEELDDKHEPEETTDPQPPDLALTRTEMLLMVSLASTGRDLIRRQLIMNTIPDEHIPQIKKTLARADNLLEKIGESHGRAGARRNH